LSRVPQAIVLFILSPEPHEKLGWFNFIGNNAGDFWLAPSPLAGEGADLRACIGGYYPMSK
jgi:hypothetical protein